VNVVAEVGPGQAGRRLRCAPDVAAQTPPAHPDVGARRSLRARLAGGPVARRIAVVDMKVFRFVRGTLHHPEAAERVAAFSRLGEHAACWLVLGGTGWLVDRDDRGRWGRATSAVVGAYLLNTALKAVLRRKRPALEDLPALIATPTKLSFPSAHSSSSFAAARAYSAMLPAPVLYAVAVPMAASRVYLGVHYPSDIAVGALLGTAIGSAGR
jgi:membrane-associated phospholipid phosphatase